MSRRLQSCVTASLRRFRCSSTYASPQFLTVDNIPAPHLGSVRILSLNRAATRNALSRQLVNELKHQVDLIREQEQGGDETVAAARALVLASEVDSCFCAGADLKERATFTNTEKLLLSLHSSRTLAFLELLRSTFDSIYSLQIPTISAISSTAFGGGLELALTTHFRVFASSATVALPETRLGIIPGAGGIHRLPALIGLNRARDLILTGRRVSGREAYALGLCNRLVEIPPDELEGKARQKVLDEAMKLAIDVCEGGPIATKAAMMALSQCARGEYAEIEAYNLVIDTEDRNEALRAFSEKRKPIFKGK